jgi:AcrR family transcriptional regulator
LPYHKGHVAEDLFATAAQLIESEGLDSLTLRRLCREVGVTAANFYNHYPSLEHLLLDVAAAGMEALQAINEKVLRRAKSRQEQLVATTVHIVDFSIEHPDLFRLMFGQIAESEKHERYSRTAAVSFAGLVQLIYGQDLYRPDDVAWSHAHAKKAYAYFAFAYGLARLVSMRLYTFPSETKAERQQFVKDLALIFAQSLDDLEPSP